MYCECFNQKFAKLLEITKTQGGELFHKNKFSLFHDVTGYFFSSKPRRTNTKKIEKL